MISSILKIRRYIQTLRRISTSVSRRSLLRMTNLWNGSTYKCEYQSLCRDNFNFKRYCNTEVEGWESGNRQKGTATKVSLEEGGKNKQHRFVAKKSIVKLVFGTLTTVLDLERELHLHRSEFPFFGKLSSGCKPKKKKRASAQNWHKAAERHLLLILCSHWGCPRSREIQVVGSLELTESIFFFLKWSLDIHCCPKAFCCAVWSAFLSRPSFDHKVAAALR